MKDFIKENYGVTLAFLLIISFVFIYYVTRDTVFAGLISSSVTGFFALATRGEKKTTQPINAENIETVNATTDTETENSA